MTTNVDELIARYLEDPSCKGRLEAPTFTTAGSNRLCGDRVSLSVLLVDSLVSQIKFETTGCVLSKAASALVCEMAVGNTVDGVCQISEASVNELLGITINLRAQCAHLPLFVLKEGLKLFLSEGNHSSTHLLA